MKPFKEWWKVPKVDFPSRGRRRDDLTDLIVKEAQGERTPEDTHRVTHAEQMTAVRVAYASNPVLHRASDALSHAMEALGNAAAGVPYDLDPSRLIRLSARLAIRENEKTLASGEALHRTERRVPPWVKPVVITLMVLLEAVFIATWVYAYVKQGRSWYSLDGAVSILVGLAHPVIVWQIAHWAYASWSHEATKRPDHHKRWLMTAAALGALVGDAAIVWHLTSFIFRAALEGDAAVSAGVRITNFPIWVMALLFMLLPITVFITAIVDADPAVEQHAVVRRQTKEALAERKRQEKRYEESIKPLRSTWLALYALCMRLGWDLHQVRLAGEHKILMTRAITGHAGLWPPHADAVQVEREQLLPLVDIIENVGLDGAPRINLQQLRAAVHLLATTQVPTRAQMDEFLRSQFEAAPDEPDTTVAAPAETATAKEPDTTVAAPVGGFMPSLTVTDPASALMNGSHS